MEGLFTLKNIDEKNVKKALDSLTDLIGKSTATTGTEKEPLLKSSTFKSAPARISETTDVVDWGVSTETHDSNNNNNNTTLFLPQTHKIETSKPDEDVVLCDNVSQIDSTLIDGKEIRDVLLNRYDDICPEDLDPNDARVLEDKLLTQEAAYFQNELHSTISLQVCDFDNDSHLIPLGLSNQWAVAIQTKNPDNITEAEIQEVENFIAITKERINAAQTPSLVFFAVKQYKQMAKDSLRLQKYEKKIKQCAGKKNKQLSEMKAATGDKSDSGTPVSLRTASVTKRDQPKFGIREVAVKKDGCVNIVVKKKVKVCTYTLPDKVRETLVSALSKKMKLKTTNKKRNARRKKKTASVLIKEEENGDEEGDEEKKEEKTEVAEGVLLVASLLNYKEASPQWKKCLNAKPLLSTNKFYVSETELASSTQSGIDIYTLPREIKIESYSILDIPGKHKVSSVFVGKDFAACIFKSEEENLIQSCQGAIFDRKNGTVYLLIMKKNTVLTSIIREPMRQSFWLGFANGCAYCFSMKMKFADLSMRSICFIPNIFPIRKMYRIGRQLYCQTTVGINAIDVVPLEKESIDQMLIRTGAPNLYKNPDISAFWRYGSLQIVVSRTHMIYITHSAARKIMKTLIPPPSLRKTAPLAGKQNQIVVDQKVTSFPMRQHVRMRGDTLIVLYSNADVRFTWTTDKIFVPEEEDVKDAKKEKDASNKECIIEDNEETDNGKKETGKSEDSTVKDKDIPIILEHEKVGEE